MDVDIDRISNSSDSELNQLAPDTLRCIMCNSNLAYDAIDKILSCQNCAEIYKVKNGIPRFVQSDAYVKNFSLEWKIHKKTQVDSEKNHGSEHNFHLRFGFPRSFWNGKRVLDVGVGVGRYAKVALDAGAEVYGVDLSYAVDVAKENLSNYSKVRLFQADVFSLPFAKETFDVIYSFGVLHHTPDPRKAFEGLLKFLKPGGVICLTLYENHGMYHTSRFLRKLTSRMPASMLYPLAVVYTLAMYVPYKYLGFRYGVLGRFAPISLSRNIREAILDTFDCYSPKYQFVYADHEIFSWFKDSGLQNIEVRPQPVTMLGFK